jgi:hypothetical protein
MGRGLANVLVSHLQTSIDDLTVETQRIGCLRAMARGRNLSDLEIGRLAQGADFFSRAIAAVSAKLTVLNTLLTDKSPFVRAVVARRLAGGKQQTEEQRTRSHCAMDILLMDSSELVRANALIAARVDGYNPTPILHGLITDDRAYVDIAELFDLFDPGAKAFRLRYGLIGISDYSISLFAKLFFQRIRSLHEPPVVVLLPPVGQRLSIAWVACERLIDADAVEAKRFFLIGVQVTKERRLRVALSRVLK